MKKHHFRILSIDGGGIRGIIPCIILKEIQSRLRRDISNVFDVIGGTSTGGIIALGLSARKPGNRLQNAFRVKDMLKLYKDHGKEIFGSRPFKSYKDEILSLHPKLSDILEKPYDAKGLEQLLQDKFGNAMLNETLTNIIVTSYDINKGESFYFSSRQAKNSNENFYIKDVARATSAAPTFFKPKEIKREKDHLVLVDGGVFANNPSVLAYSEAKNLWYEQGEKVFSNTEDADTEKPVANDRDLPFFMLSIGTGQFKKGIETEKLKKSKDWIEPLLKQIFMDSVSENTHYTMKHLLPKFSDGTPRYYRLNVDLSYNIEMDDVSDENLKNLEEIAEEYIAKPRTQELLDEICGHLK